MKIPQIYTRLPEDALLSENLLGNTKMEVSKQEVGLRKVHQKCCLVDVQVKPKILHIDTEHKLLKETERRYNIAKDFLMKTGNTSKARTPETSILVHGGSGRTRGRPIGKQAGVNIKDGGGKISKEGNE